MDHEGNKNCGTHDLLGMSKRTNKAMQSKLYQIVIWDKIN